MTGERRGPYCDALDPGERQCFFCGSDWHAPTRVVKHGRDLAAEILAAPVEATITVRPRQEAAARDFVRRNRPGFRITILAPLHPPRPVPPVNPIVSFAIWAVRANRPGAAALRYEAGLSHSGEIIWGELIYCRWRDPVGEEEREPHFDYQGDLVVLTERWRKEMRGSMGYAHVMMGAGLVTWGLQAPEAFELPALITSERDLSLVFSGAVGYERPRERRKWRCLKGIACGLPVSVLGLPGYLSWSPSGLLRKRTWHLRVFGRETGIPAGRHELEDGMGFVTLPP